MMNKTGKILIVDDDEASRALLRGILHDYPNLYEATDGLEALSFLHRNPDTALVLLDIVMPRMTGLEVLTRMRLSPYLVKTPVLVISGAGGTELQHLALKLGATEFATKPYDSMFLRRRIATLLQLPPIAPAIDPNSFAMQMFHQSESLDVGLCVYELDAENTLRIIFFSDTFAKQFGYTEEECASFVRDHAALDRVIHVDDQRSVHQALEALAADRQPFCQNVRMQCKDGSIHQIAVYANLYEGGDDGTILHMLTVRLPDDPSASEPMHPTASSGTLDRVTGLPNAISFLAETRQMLNERPGEPFVLVVSNIDRFKVVNDLYGMKVGNNVLVALAARLRDFVFGRGTIGHLGADLFAMCLPTAEFDLNELLRRQSSLSESIGLNYNLTLHSGIYVIAEPNLDVSQMCDRARLALSTVKDNYIVRYAYYDAKMRQEIIAEQQILNEMHQSLLDGDFVLYLQPIYSLHFDRPISAEALVRWRHGKDEIISPAQFIPLFERNRFITNLDHYMWENCCRYIASRREKGLPAIPISVNVSRANLYNPDLAKELTALLAKYEVSPALLRLEITESAYMENPRKLVQSTEALHKAGFKILIDDFGSGYSSLNMLKEIPLDILKIDMRFLEDLEASSRAANILLGVIRIAQSLNTFTIAEGVESKFQVDFLRTAGCDSIQGYYYKQPLPTEEFTEFLKHPPLVL